MNEDTDDGPSALRTTLVVSLMFGLIWALIFGYMAYNEYQEEGWGQHACEEKYGESAEYVGETSAFGGSGICDVDGEQKYVEVEYEGMLPPGE